jgi:hypothetical protein
VSNEISLPLARHVGEDDLGANVMILKILQPFMQKNDHYVRWFSRNAAFED